MLYGVDYGLRRPDNSCPTVAQVEADLQIIAQYTTRVRIYSIVDCNGAQILLQAIRSSGVNIVATLGMWLDQYFQSEFPNELYALDQLIENVGLEYVEAILVGSETQYRGDFSASQLETYLQSVTTTLHNYGYNNVTVATADVIYNLMNNDLTNHESVVYANEFAFWEGTAIQDSVSLIETQLGNLKNTIAANKPRILSETGWPTQGGNFGNSVPSVANLNTYLNGLVCWLHSQNIGYFWFEIFDEPNKDPVKNGGVEMYFGLFDSSRQLKSGIQLPVLC